MVENEAKKEKSNSPGRAVAQPRSEFVRRPQGFDARRIHAYETLVNDPDRLQLFCYTDRLSYRPGDEVIVHASTNTQNFSLEIRRDDGTSKPLATIQKISAPFTAVPDDFAAQGCNWPVAARLTVPLDAPSGFYLMIARGTDAKGNIQEQEHGFTVLAASPGEKAPILFVLATSTWAAYNDWGGSCHYLAHNEPRGLPIAPILSIHRPWARGFMSLSPGAPMKGNAWSLEPGAAPRYPQEEFAALNGYTRYYANAGWANYERHFALWAEREGYRFDFATQTDLHNDPDILTPYRCVVIVGHDEYWSWEMREAIDRYVEAGGRVARFGGNFAWQIRIEGGGTRQVCYKSLARDLDPVVGTENQRRATVEWEDSLVNWSGAATFGLSAAWGGVYANYGVHAPRGSGGFTIYRPDHWAFQGGNFYYGDVLGASARIFGYEVDGLDNIVKDGLPVPTFSDGAPANLQILAMAPASDDDVDGMAILRYGNNSPENLERAARGTGMIVHFTRGAGEVFNTGVTDWVAGLAARELGTEIVTRNVLDRFIRG
ncbi:hypothetical protein QN219_30360 [Sinorhizobium sp. 7-81]|uniref:N,N-dimethylformamidase beta subunit family domain-containing protein n=1 Tax=Sinorhizobium sp. 8-89 TaxID=3049089 RepID=UPI0024C21ED5|nr:N,N-dimethylformamidase beta subunit family domain-containing protein [Sinorhizobium sp. 8-89]MDK1494267.1 hypothetical protein [Sinorhizobium sp. 8-89]